MNPNTLKVLAVATAIVAAGAVAASKMRGSENAAASTGELVLSVLQERVNDVHSILIESKDGPVTLEHGAAGWSLAEKDGYGADSAKVRALVLGLREARILEQKTANQKRFGKLGLDAPSGTSSSKRVTLSDEKGAEIATLLIGHQRTSPGGAPQGSSVRPDDQFYVHVGGEAPAVLAAGALRIDASPSSWMDQQLINIGRDRIRAARVTHPNGSVVAAAREEMDATELEALDIPDGMQPKGMNGTRPFLDALANLRFDDVQKEDGIDWSAAESTTAEFFTEHGLRATVETVEVPQGDTALDAEGQPLPGEATVWARFRFEEAPEGVRPMGTAPEAPEAPEATEEAADDGAPAGSPGDAPSAVDQAKELADLQAKTHGWAFALPTWKLAGFRLDFDAVFEPIPVPELPEELAPADDIPMSLPVVDPPR